MLLGIVLALLTVAASHCTASALPEHPIVQWHVNVSQVLEGGVAVTAGIAAIAPGAVASGSPALLALITQDSNVTGSGTLWLVDAATGHIDVGSAVNISVAVPQFAPWQLWSITTCDGGNSVCVAGFSAQATRYRIVSHTSGAYRFQLAWTLTLPTRVGMAPMLLPGYDGQAEEALAFAHGFNDVNLMLVSTKSGKLLWNISVEDGIYSIGATVDTILVNSVYYPETRIPMPFYTTTLLFRGNATMLSSGTEQLAISATAHHLYAVMTADYPASVQAWPALWNSDGWNVALPFPNGGVEIASLLIPANQQTHDGLFVACGVNPVINASDVAVAFNTSCIAIDLVTGVTLWMLPSFQVPTDPLEGAVWGVDLSVCADNQALCVVITPQNDPATLLWIDLKTGTVNPKTVTLGRNGNGGISQPVTAVGVVAAKGKTATVGTVAMTEDSVYGLAEPTSSP